MPREADLSLNEREFIQQALRENTRLDGRAFDAFRQVELSFGDEYGVADVRLGKTRSVFDELLPESLTHHMYRVVARVSAEVIAPYPDRKFDGVFTISTEFSPMASPAFEVGRYVYCALSCCSRLPRHRAFTTQNLLT